jgi:hypothetical protein
MRPVSPQSVFQEDGDRYKWDKYLEQLKWIELSKLNKKRAYKAIQFFRSLLGEEFLRKGRRHHHPFYYELSNSAEMARLRIIHFADLLESFKQAEGFESIERKLKRVR